jgi:hypothetical protein
LYSPHHAAVAQSHALPRALEREAVARVPPPGPAAAAAPAAPGAALVGDVAHEGDGGRSGEGAPEKRRRQARGLRASL